MSATFTIQLTNLRFTAAHGLFTEEAQVKNDFEVNISLTVKAPEQKVTTIEETINYVDAYSIVKDIFSVPCHLLETLSMDIAESLKRQFPALRKVSVQIIKVTPPITSFIGSVSVTYSKKYKD
jgi:dihydroneopterin aldolase